MPQEQAPMTAEAACELIASGAPANGLIVAGTLDYSRQSQRALPRSFPDQLSVDFLNLAGTSITRLPRGLSVQELDLSSTPVRSLPDDLRVRTRLSLAGCENLESLPRNLSVGSLDLRGCNSLRSLPEGLDVWFLDLSGCWAFDDWPREARIRSGQLQVRGCTALRNLPHYIRRLSALNVRDCPNLTSLPDDLVVTGWLDLAHSGLTDESSLPRGLQSTQLRWAGVNVDRRIAFHPETLTVDEVLQERNAERRRVLLDRFGYGRFLKEARAQVLHQDSDPGGTRQLLKVELKDDEPLVAMSCFCPSTGRQYVIRVPPVTRTCHEAAAWIAGFDNPDDYRPVIET